MILEEAAYMDEPIYEGLIRPLLNVQESCILLISTLRTDGKGDAFRKLLESGKLLTYKVTYICDTCLEESKWMIDRPCKHWAHIVPPHIAFGDDDDDGGPLSALSKHENENSRQLRLHEMFGVMFKTKEEEERYVFSEQSVDRFLSKPRTVGVFTKYIFCSIDPSAGSLSDAKSTSDFCAVCVSIDTVLGVMALNSCSHTDYEGALHQLLTKIRASGSPYQYSTIVFDIEANGSGIWSYIEKYVRNTFNNVMVIGDNVRKSGGTITDRTLKEEAAMLLKEKLETGTLAFWDGFVATGTWNMGELKRQLRSYERKIKEIKGRGRNGGKEISVTYCGKGPNLKSKDDMCFTLQRALYRQQRFYRGLENNVN